jgi:hypothetical protein
MVAGVKLWALAHLLANGNLADLLLFGAFLAWAVADFISARRRDRAAGRTYPVSASHAAWCDRHRFRRLGGLFAFWGHAWLIGVAPFARLSLKRPRRWRRSCRRKCSGCCAGRASGNASGRRKTPPGRPRRPALRRGTGRRSAGCAARAITRHSSQARQPSISGAPTRLAAVRRERRLLQSCRRPADFRYPPPASAPPARAPAR